MVCIRSPDRCVGATAPSCLGRFMRLRPRPDGPGTWHGLGSAERNKIVPSVRVPLVTRSFRHRLNASGDDLSVLAIEFALRGKLAGGDGRGWEAVARREQ